MLSLLPELVLVEYLELLLEILFLVTVDLEVVPSTVKVLYPLLRPDAPQNPIRQNSDPIAKYVCFFHLEKINSC